MADFHGGNIVDKVEHFGRKNRMSDEQYESLVKSADELAKRDRSGYNLRVALLAALGYGFCLGFVGLFFGIAIFFCIAMINSRAHYLGFKGALLFGALALLIVKALWVKLPPVEGRRITREEAPKLFEIIDEISAKLKTKIDLVVMNTQFTCAVEQRPRLGLLGFPENVLHLGIPYLLTLTPDQFRGTLSHEMGHLSGNHGTFGAWIFCLRESWSNVLDNLRAGSPLIYSIFYVFANWYMPIFHAYTFSLARTHEEEADESAREIVGSKVAAERFVRIVLNGDYLSNNFYKRLGELPKTEPEPPKDVYLQMVNELRNLQIAPEEGREWLRKALEEKSDLADPHPSMYERIAVLNCKEYDPEVLREQGPPDKLLHAQQNAADTYIGKDFIDKVAMELSAETYEYAVEGWQARYAEYEQARKDLASLEEKRQEGPLGKDDLWTLVVALHDLHGKQEALPVAQEAMERFPDESWPHAVIGTTYLEDRDERGIQYLETAMNRDTKYVESACWSIIQFYEKRGEKELSKKYKKRLEDYEESLAMAQVERRDVKDSDQFEPHNLPSELIQKLAAQIAEYKDVDAAYIARKQVEHLPEYPHYVIAVKPKFSLHGEERNYELVCSLHEQLEFNESFTITVIDGFRKKIEDKMSTVPDAPLYGKAKSKNANNN